MDTTDRSAAEAKGGPPAFRFDRMELAGSLGDLGTILPLSIGMILINGLDPTGVFTGLGLFYIFSGLYFRVTTPVEPMKVIGAYAVATGITANQIQAANLWVCLFLVVVGASGAISLVGRWIPKPVVRGVQLSTGVLLVSQGVRLMMGTSTFQTLQQAPEPYLAIQRLGPVPIGLVIGGLLAVLTLFLLDSKRLPAALVVVVAGLLSGALLGVPGNLGDLTPGIHLPRLLPFGWPSAADFSFALLVLVVPQIPMTLGNAVIANADLSLQYFPRDGRRVTYRALCISMGLAGLMSFLLGGMPMCHGAGGLASRYRFGARTAGSNLIVGGLFVALAVLLGPRIMEAIYLLPMAALGVLLVFAGGQLTLTLLDMKTRKDLFVPILVLGITLAANLAAGFLVGIAVACALQSERLTV